MATDKHDAAHASTPAAATQAPHGAEAEREPLWNSKGNVIHAAVDRLRERQRLAALATQAPSSEARDALVELGLWLHAAYDRPPQTPEAVAMLKRFDAALAREQAK